MRTLVLALCFSLVPASALACEASDGGTRSFDLHVSPRAGIFCFYTLTLYEGAICEVGREIASSTEGCAGMHRLAVTDEGTFVSIAAPRASHRDWAIVRVFRIGEGARSVSVTLDDLRATSPLHGVIRVSFDQGAIAFRDREAQARVTLAELAGRL